MDAFRALLMNVGYLTIPFISRFVCLRELNCCAWEFRMTNIYVGGFGSVFIQSLFFILA